LRQVGKVPGDETGERTPEEAAETLLLYRRFSRRLVVISILLLAGRSFKSRREFALAADVLLSGLD